MHHQFALRHTLVNSRISEAESETAEGIQKMVTPRILPSLSPVQVGGT